MYINLNTGFYYDFITENTTQFVAMSLMGQRPAKCSLYGRPLEAL